MSAFAEPHGIAKRTTDISLHIKTLHVNLAESILWKQYPRKHKKIKIIVNEFFVRNSLKGGTGNLQAVAVGDHPPERRQRLPPDLSSPNGVDRSSDQAKAYRYCTNDPTAPSMPATFGLLDSIT